LKINNLRLGGIFVALVAVFILAAKLYQPPAPGTSTSPTATPSAVPSAAADPTVLLRPHSPTLGPDQAPVTIVEFFDPECESCRAMYPIVKQVMAEFDGRVRLVIRYMPNHQNSGYASSLLEAARVQNKYWEFLDIVMARQPEWASHAAPRPDLLVTYAAPLGINVRQLAADATEAEVRQRIQQDQSDGMALGANRTPTFFINGLKLPRLGHEELRSAVRSQLK
jgi:protein-disulfide isomerase